MRVLRNQENVVDFEKSEMYFGFSGMRKILWVLWSEDNLMDFEKSGKYCGFCVARKTLWIFRSQGNILGSLPQTVE